MALLFLVVVSTTLLCLFPTSVHSSLAGGGALGEVNLIYVPEPSALILLGLGILGPMLTRVRRHR